MTRKHFIATANILARISNPSTRLSISEDFADMFAAENPRFDREKFLAAAGNPR